MSNDHNDASQRKLAPAASADLDIPLIDSKTPLQK